MKLALPALIGGVIALLVVGCWVNQILQNSFRTQGTFFSEYAATYPVVNNPNPKTVFWCDPAYPRRWVGCFIQ